MPWLAGTANFKTRSRISPGGTEKAASPCVADQPAGGTMAALPSIALSRLFAILTATSMASSGDATTVWFDSMLKAVCA